MLGLKLNHVSKKGHWWRHMTIYHSDGGMLPDGAKPLPDPVVTDHLWSFATFIAGQFPNNAHDIYSWYEFGNHNVQIIAAPLTAQWIDFGLAYYGK